MTSLGIALALQKSTRPLVNRLTVGGAVLWLRGDDVAAGGVAAWPDKSGSGNNATQSNSLHQPTAQARQINGHSAVAFNGSSDFLNLSLTLSDLTIFSVITQTGDNVVFGNSVDNHPQFRVGQGGANILSTYDGSANVKSSALAAAPGSWSLLEWKVASSAVTFYQNGDSYGTGTFSSPQSITTIGLLQSGIWLNGSIAEILIYPSALSDPDRKSVESYLAAKYRINGVFTYLQPDGASQYLRPDATSAYKRPS